MWYLTCESDDRILYVIPGSKQIIGRTAEAGICDFPLYNDSSVSRKHAMITIVNNTLVVQDLGSLFGTFVIDSNNMKSSVAKLSEVVVKQGQKILFGKLTNIWELQRIDFITCTSTLKGDQLQKLMRLLPTLGAILKTDWDASCSYLTMPAITLTIKVVLALIQGSYIVNISFWDNVLKSVETRSKLPEATKFVPQIAESTLNKDIVSFLPDPRRKYIFRHKKFVFFARKQYDMYKGVISLGLGEPLLLSEGKITKAMLCDKNVIVIQMLMTNQDSQTLISKVNEIVGYLKSKGRRVIPDAEIGLGILYCSLAKYCNPEFKFSSEILKSPEAVDSKVSILAHESQETTFNRQVSKEVKIDESLMSVEGNLNEGNENRLTAGKRKFCEENVEMNEHKKRATDSVENINDNEDMFNFVTPSNIIHNTEKKLNFVKPYKRKADHAEADDDLFNFLPGNTNANDESNKSFFLKDEFNHDAKRARLHNSECVDVSTTKGTKLKDLTENNNSWRHRDDEYIKKEMLDEDELQEKFCNLDLGSTVIVIRDDLIVKKEQLVVENLNIFTKNFKKFKKVWPTSKKIIVQ